jgi:hypothetical protein
MISNIAEIEFYIETIEGFQTRLPVLNTQGDNRLAIAISGVCATGDAAQSVDSACNHA